MKKVLMIGLVVLVAALALGLGLAPSRATAIPVFAHRYGFSCQQCHSTVPHLNDFGERFRAAGFRIPGAPEHGTLPIAVKVNLAYSSEPDPNGLPKALVDEVELLSAEEWAETAIVYAVRPVAGSGDEPALITPAPGSKCVRCWPWLARLR